MQIIARIAAVACALGFAAGCGAGIAHAQDIDAGKSPAQLFASHCAACHRGPQGLAAGQSASAVAGFLTQHYTADRASAGQLAAYLVSVGGERRSSTRPGARGPAAAGRPEAAPRDGDRISTGRKGAARDKAAASRQRRARRSAQPTAASPDTPSVIISTQPHAVTPGSRPLRRPRRPAVRKPPAAAQ